MGRKSKSTKGRTISKVKRNNQKRNKLIKKGKLKPNSNSAWVKAQIERNQNKKSKANIQKKDSSHLNRSDEESEIGENEMMDVEDAVFLSGMRLNKNEADLANLEAKAVERYNWAMETEKPQKGLLPIKTKSGVIMKTIDIDKKLNSDSEQEDENLYLNGQNDDLEEKEEQNGDEINEATERTVLSLLSERETSLEDLKVQVGNLASSFLQNPEEKLINLDKLIQMMDSQPSVLRNTGFKLISTTVNELLKDIIPNYRIVHHNQENSLLKKETLKLQKYEKGILESAKAHLMKLEKQLINEKDKMTEFSRGFHGLKCLCDLLISHPQFNFAPNIINLIIPRLDDKVTFVRSFVQESFEQLFREDKRGEISLLAVRGIKKYMKTKKYNCNCEALDCMLKLRLNYVDLSEKENDNIKKNQKQQMSKKEKKRLKQLQKVEKEMLEAKGEESKVVRNKNFTEVSKALFEMLFHIVKSSDKMALKKLLPSALTCISKFCHTINVDFFDDLLRVLSGMLKKLNLSPKDQLLCVKTAFDILTGPGEFLTYDPGHFAKVTYDLIPILDLNFPETSSTLCDVIRKMIIKRKKQVSKDVVHAFAKAITTACMNLDSDAANEYLSTLLDIKSCHLKTFEIMLDSEENVPSKVSSFTLKEGLDVGTCSLWELDFLRNHFVKEISTKAKKLSQYNE